MGAGPSVHRWLVALHMWMRLGDRVILSSDNAGSRVIISLLKCRRLKTETIPTFVGLMKVIEF
jgi:hypothetical protein